jgi:hypothetical protein
MLQNVQTLKLAAESGVTVIWNLLYGFPGDSVEAYERTARIMPKLRHLPPPSGCGRVLADRFSPYFQQPESFGVRLEPAAAYRFIHPFDEDSVRRLAYHFHMHSSALDRIEDTVAPMDAERRLWSEHHADSALSCEDAGETMIVTEARWGWERAVHELDGAEAALLRLCWRITPRHRIAAELAPRFSDPSLRAAIARLLHLGLLLQEDDLFLALPLRQSIRQPAGEGMADAGTMPFALCEPA